MTDCLLPQNGVFPRSQRWARAVLAATLSAAGLSGALGATFLWNIPGGGAWEETSHWSVPALPGAADLAAITNAGAKTVAITARTVAAYEGGPVELGRLELAAPPGSTNTLAAGPLLANEVLSFAHLDIGSNGVFRNLGATILAGKPLGEDCLVSGSYLQENGHLAASDVDWNLSGFFRLAGGSTMFKGLTVGRFGAGTFEQAGGTNTPRTLWLASLQDPFAVCADARYLLQAGRLEARDIVAGQNARAEFIQSGGELAAERFGLGSGQVHVTDGLLDIQSLRIGDYSRQGSWVQEGGRIRTDGLLLGSGAMIRDPGHGRYLLASGELEAAGVRVGADGGTGAFEQTGGQLVAGQISITGGAGIGFSTRSSEYSLVEGELIGGQLDIGMLGQFLHRGGTSQLQTLTLNAPFFAPQTNIWIRGGAFECDRAMIAAGALRQEGGTFRTRRLQIERGTELSPAVFELAAGELSAEEIELAGTLVVAGGSELRHSGSLVLSGGTLRVETTEASLGPLTLSAESFIDLGDGIAEVRFAASSNQPWDPSATLLVTNWSGSLNGGPGDRLVVEDAGLTPAQLSAIRFANPQGFPVGVYGAELLATGELVPRPGSPAAALAATLTTEGMMLSWPPGWVLQTSSSPAGPFTDLSHQSPFLNTMGTEPSRFFRLRLETLIETAAAGQ